VVYVLAELKGEDDTGPKSVQLKSLVRIVGKVGQDVSPTDGAPVIRASYYRHWPVYTYVTRSAASHMRQ
jgi:hypothetical protein